MAETTKAIEYAGKADSVIEPVEVSIKCPSRFDDIHLPPLDLFQQVQREVSEIIQTLAQMEKSVSSHDGSLALGRLIPWEVARLKSLGHDVETRIIRFVETQGLFFSPGLSCLLDDGETTLSQLYRELLRIQNVLHLRSIRLFAEETPNTARLVQPLVDEGDSAEAIPRPRPERSSLVKGKLRDIHPMSFAQERESMPDTIHFGILDHSADISATVRFSGAALGGNIADGSLTFEHIHDFVAGHINLVVGRSFELWVYGRRLTQESYHDLIFSYAQNKVIIVLDPQITVQIQLPDDTASTYLHLDFSGQLRNRSRTTSQEIKDLVSTSVTAETHPAWFTFDSNSGNAKMKEIYLYLNKHPLRQSYLSLGHSGRLSIRAREGFEPILVVASVERMKHICGICGNHKFEENFPKKSGAACSHKSNTCYDCVRSWLETFMSYWRVQDMTCPECNLGFTKDEVLAVLPDQKARDRLVTLPPMRLKLMASRYTYFLELVDLSALKTFAWCSSPGCNSGQIHDDDTMPMICKVCSFEQCAKHTCAWSHPAAKTDPDSGDTDTISMTCEAFEQEIVLKIRSADNIAAQQLMDTTTKKCPGCEARIEKDEGCDHMSCRCGFQFCWECLVDWRRSGGAPREHVPGCIHYRPPTPTFVADDLAGGNALDREVAEATRRVQEAMLEAQAERDRVAALQPNRGGFLENMRRILRVGGRN
jgi:hypothetical protein